MRFRDGSNEVRRGTASNFVQILESWTETLTMIRQPFGEESTSRTRVFEWYDRFRADQKKAKQIKSKVKSMPIIFFKIKGIVNKEFTLAGQTVTSAYYCDVVWRLHEYVLRLNPELW
jgi:hypothetical protein